MHDVNFGLTATDYARHRAGFSRSLLERLSAHGIGVPGQAVIDLGTGTLAGGFARCGCRVIGIDPSQSMLDQARHLDEEAAVQVSDRAATAEETGLPHGCAEVVAAGQCWQWLDRPRAARECAHVLRSDGFLSFSYDVDGPCSSEAWRGRVRASAGVGASLSPDRGTAFDRDLEKLIRSEFPGPVLHTPHRVFAVWPPVSESERRL
jgi:SAM-dependent methyltransferase